MRVDCTSTLAKGKRFKAVDETSILKGLDKVGRLMRRLDDANAAQRGRRKQRKTESWLESEGERLKLIEEVETALAKVVSSLPPRLLLPDGKMKFFVQAARNLGLLPLKKDFESAPTPYLGRKVEPAEESSGRPSSEKRASTSRAPAPTTETCLPLEATTIAHLQPLLVTENAYLGGLGPSSQKRKRTGEDNHFKKRVYGAAAQTMPNQNENSVQHPGESFERTTHLPLIQRVIVNFAPKDATIGLEKDVTTRDVLKSLRDFATRPKSIVKGETHVNKTAVSLFQRMKENALGIRDVYTEQLQEVRMEAIREEEEKMKILDASLPGHDQLARMFQAAYTTMQGREPDYTLKKIRLEFLDVLSQLHPEDPGCSVVTLRLYMKGQYDIRRHPKWRHAIHELCKDINNLDESSKENAVPVTA